MRRAKAFTLVELLVVISIIAVLLTILLPSMVRMKEMVRRVICGSRLHNIGVSCISYTVDNRGELFPCRNRTVQICLNPPEWRASKTVGLDKQDWECPNRTGMFLFEGTPNDMSAAEYRRRGYTVIDSGYDYDQWILGYQYFAGIVTWNTQVGSFPSRSPLNNSANGDWALAADGDLMVDGYWGGGRPAAFGMIPAHPAPNGEPEGGNVLTFAGSVTWYTHAQMLPIHSWSPWGRVCYWWQDDLGEYGERIGR